MEFYLLNAAVGVERRQWLTLLEKIPADRRDVYFQPEYIQAYVNSADVEAYCAIYVSDSAILMYPFLKSRLIQENDLSKGESLYDIQSAYGYGGPVVNSEGEDPLFLQQAWGLFAKWCDEERVVTEFVRFHPLLENVRWASTSMDTFEDRKTVSIELESYESDLKNTSYYRRHRQMLNKAARMGFSFNVLPAKTELDWFVPLYLKTQESLQAGSDTRFTVDYFKTLTAGLGQSTWLGVVRNSDGITAATLVLEGPTCLHSHLMGYRKDIPTAGMTNLLYHGIALEGANRNKALLHMGGGLAASEEDPLFRFEEDPLFRFKASLGPSRAVFCLGTLCHNHDKYAELGLEWESRNGPRPKNYFQFYRLSDSV